MEKLEELLGKAIDTQNALQLLVTENTHRSKTNTKRLDKIEP